MTKQTTAQGKGGCVTKLVIGVGIEVAIAVICINVFGMGEESTLYFLLAALYGALAFAAYHDDAPTPKVNQSRELLEDDRVTKACPYCLSVNIITDENGAGFCNDCDYCWGVEDVQ